MNKRSQYILSIFYPKYIPDIEKATELVDQIYDIGESSSFNGLEGSDNRRYHKFDTWIAVQIKNHFKNNNNFELIKEVNSFLLIIDCFINEKIDIFKFSFQEAFEYQKKWHEENFKIKKNLLSKKLSIDESRIIFISNNKKYFVYNLTDKDLSYEGNLMGNCVGGVTYKKKVKEGSAFIVSLRDKKNEPHITIEILFNKKSGKFKMNQFFGKQNREPKEEYLDYLKEYLLNFEKSTVNF